MRQHVGGECGEAQGNRPRRRPEPTPRPEEHGHDQRRAQGHDREPAEEEKPLPVVPAVQEAPAELPLARRDPGRVVGQKRRRRQQQRGGGEQLHEGGLLRVQAVIAEREVSVAGGEVGPFVEGGRVPAHRVNGETGVEGHGGNDERHAPAAAHGCGRPGAFTRGTTSSIARTIACAAMRWAISFGCSSAVPFTTSSLQSTLL